MREDSLYRRVRRRLESWNQHFELVLNVQKEVEANVLGDLEEHSETDIPQMTREEVELAVKKL